MVTYTLYTPLNIAGKSFLAQFYLWWVGYHGTPQISLGEEQPLFPGWGHLRLPLRGP